MLSIFSYNFWQKKRYFHGKRVEEKNPTLPTSVNLKHTYFLGPKRPGVSSFVALDTVCFNKMEWSRFGGKRTTFAYEP